MLLKRTITLLSALIIPLSWADYPYSFEVSSPNQVQILLHGPSSLEKRLEIIERAQKTIELEYYIYNSSDFSTKILTHALIQKAQEGVKIRILIDGFPWDGLNPFYAHVLSQGNIAVRYYNRFSLPFILRHNRRNHRKLLLVDGSEFITGGRNISDTALNLDANANYIDIDIWVHSSQLASAALATFNDYWTSPRTSTPTPPLLPVPDGPRYESRMRFFNKKVEKAKNFMSLTETEELAIEKIREFARSQLESEDLVGQCNTIGFATDSPIGKGKVRELSREIARKISAVENSLFLISPYFILTQKQKKTLTKLLRKNISVSILTNSLYSTNSPPNALVFATRIKGLLREGVEAFVYSGDSLTEDDYFNQEIQESHYGLHGKALIFDDHSFFIGSHNLNPRSESFDLEIGIFCSNSPRLAQGLRDRLKTLQDHSIRLNKKGGYPLFERTSLRRKALSFLLFIPSHLLRFLL